MSSMTTDATAAADWLIDVARSDAGYSRQAANFLLERWNGPDWAYRMASLARLFVRLVREDRIKHDHVIEVLHGIDMDRDRLEEELMGALISERHRV